ncbi:MAG: SpoIIE family protein phosphatase [Flavobacteriales bacterium]
MSTFLLKGQFSKPFVKNYTPKDYNAFFQNWDAVQDKRGVMYFANNYGILVFSGNKWDVVGAPNGSIIRSLVLNSDGKVVAGGYNEIGIIESDKLGNPTFKSITTSLKEEFQDFGSVWNIVQLKNSTYFSTDRYILKYENDKLTKVADKGGKLFSKVGNTIYLSTDSSGLMKFENEKLHELPHGNFFSKMKIYGVVENRNGLMVVTKDDGIYFYSSDTIYEVGNVKTKTIFKQSDLYSALLLPDGNISISTLKNGVIILNQIGEIEEIFNKQSGVQHQTCWKTFFDKQGNLWLMLDKGITKIEYNSPFSSYNTNGEIEGTIMSIERFNNNMFVATSVGLYQSKTTTTPFGDKLEFKLIPEIKSQCWDLLEINDKILVASSGGVFGINKQDQITRYNNDIVYVLKKSSYYANLIFTGREDGLSLVNFNQGWKEDVVPEVNTQVRSIFEESESNIWLGTYVNGAINFNYQLTDDFKILSSNVKSYSYDQGLKGLEVDVFNYNNDVVFSTDIGLMKKSEKNGKIIFYPDTTLGKSFSNSTRLVYRLMEDHLHNIWMYAPITGLVNNEPLGFVKEHNNNYIYNYQQFNRLPQGIIYAIYPDYNSDVWLGGVEGLFKYNHLKNSVKYNAIFYTLLNKVSISNDSIVHVGIFGLPKPVYEITYENNNIQFEFSCTNFLNEQRNQFQYKLEGFDDDWSEWTTESKKQYTNLFEGNYIFKVRSRNAFNDLGIETVFRFKIIPPWYRGWVAYVVYVLALALLIWLIVKLSVYRLKLANLKLEGIIKLRTKEIREKNEQLSDALTDIKDSINYAKRLQEAILPKQTEIDRVFPENFVFFAPRDIVSGDFYWLSERKNNKLFIVADCTGHGVPGAFVSMLGNDLLNHIVDDNMIDKPSQILTSLNQGVQNAFRSNDLKTNSNDGMDISVISIDEKLLMKYSGANRPLFIVRDNELIELKPDKTAIGGRTEFDFKFEEQSFQLIKNDLIYMFSDGFADQFGGVNNKKFLIKRLKELLLRNSNLSMNTQKEILKNEFLEWKKDVNQLDDVLVTGIRI